MPTSARGGTGGGTEGLSKKLVNQGHIEKKNARDWENGEKGEGKSPHCNAIRGEIEKEKAEA